MMYVHHIYIPILPIYIIKNEISTCHEKDSISLIIRKQDGLLTGIVGGLHIHLNSIL